MDQISYRLDPVPPSPNMPDASWAKDLTTSAQNVMDLQYLHGPGGLDNFYAQAKTWLVTETMKRGSNPNYQPAPFRMAIPRREFVTWDENGTSSSERMPPNPGIRLPELPPLPAPSAPATTFGGPHSPDDDVMTKLNIILAQLDLLNRTLDQLLRGQ